MLLKNLDKQEVRGEFALRFANLRVGSVLCEDVSGASLKQAAPIRSSCSEQGMRGRARDWAASWTQRSGRSWLGDSPRLTVFVSS